MECTGGSSAHTVAAVDSEITSVSITHGRNETGRLGGKIVVLIVGGGVVVHAGELQRQRPAGRWIVFDLH